MNENPYDPYKNATGGYSNPGPYGYASGQDPYAQDPNAYGPAEYGPVVPLYPAAPPKADHEGRAVTALILSCVQLVLCCGLTAIPGVVFGALALGEKYDTERGARMTRNAWLSVWINFGILALGAVLLIVVIALDIASST
ncbi:hypothetical protein SUDANB121_03866 [Nocardiopsis dassonvillei]|uniref:hypothetical protein n=1 Tax=Nocardiopsis dassonvillei TaxID=2014 RepID=UPI003F56F4D6